MFLFDSLFDVVIAEEESNGCNHLFILKKKTACDLSFLFTWFKSDFKLFMKTVYDVLNCMQAGKQTITFSGSSWIWIWILQFLRCPIFKPLNFNLHSIDRRLHYARPVQLRNGSKTKSKIHSLRYQFPLFCLPLSSVKLKMHKNTFFFSRGRKYILAAVQCFCNSSHHSFTQFSVVAKMKNHKQKLLCQRFCQL